MDLFKRIQDLSAIYDDDGPSAMVQERPMFADGQLVQPSDDGSRPGYAGEKYVEVDGTKYRIIQRGPKKNKIAFRGRDLEGSQTYEYFDNKTQIKNRLKKGKKQNIDKQIKLKAESAADVNRVRDNIDSWTNKWVKDNFDKYEIQNNNKFVQDLKKAWSKESKKNIYKLSEDVFQSGFSRWTNDSINVSDFPNFTQVQASSERTPLKIEGIFKTAGNMDTQPTSYDNFFKKTFFANKLNSNKKLKNQFNKVFDFVNKDKSKLSQKNFIKAHGDFLTNVDPDVMYMLSDDALYSTARYDLFSKTFGNSYEKYRENYIKKTNNYFKTAAVIEKKLGLPNNFITNQLAAEQQLLKKVFKVKSLPPAFQYSMDHGMGLSYAASTNDKGIMKQAVNTLLGMTNAQNQALGMGGWEKNRIKLLKNVKKDPSLLPELNAHMKLGYGDILPNQETFYKIEGTGRNKKIIPTFEGQNQPDRFKSYVNQISKQTVSNIKQAFPDKTVQKSILDFKKGDTKSLNKLLNTDLLKLAGTVNPKCRKAAVDGGRIGFQDGLSTEFCINEGKKVARDLVAKNITGSPAQNSIIKRVTSGVTNFVKSALDPKELFDFKKQFLSKGAVASLPIFDAGIAAYEAAAMGKPIKEAISNTLTFGSIPRAMGAGLDTPDVLNAKQLLKDPNLSPAGKEYAQLIIDSGNYEQMQSDTTGGMTKKFNQFKEIQDKIKNASTAGRFDYESRLNEIEGAEMAKDDYSPIFGSLGDPLKNRAINSGPKTRGGRGAAKDYKIDLSPVTYENFKPNYGFTKEQFEDAMRKEGVLADDEVYQDAFYKQGVEKPIEFQQLMELPSFRGASEKFAGGGIAGLSGGDPKGAMLTSMNPDSQGLQGLFNRVKKV